MNKSDINPQNIISVLNFMQTTIIILKLKIEKKQWFLRLLTVVREVNAVLYSLQQQFNTRRKSITLILN